MCTPGKRGYKPDRFSGDHADRPAPHPPQQVPFGHAPCGASSVPVPVRPRSRSWPCALCRHPHRVRARSRSRRQGGSRLAPVDARDEASPGTSLEAPCPARRPRPRRESPQPRDRERRFVGADRPSRAAPQVVGALVGLSCLGDRHRLEALQTARLALLFPGGGFTDLVDWLDSSPPEMGLPASERERMWTSGELGIEVVDVRDAEVSRADVLTAFRRRMREEHPDHGAERDGAAERLARLRAARGILTGTDG